MASHDSQTDFTRLPIVTLVSCDSHGIDYVVSQTKGNHFRDCHPLSFIKKSIEVNMNHLSSFTVQQNVLQVSVSQTNDVANHRHDCIGTNEVVSRDMPFTCVLKVLHEPGI